MSVETNTLPPIDEIESSPDFQSLDVSGQQEVLNGYFTERSERAQTEDDYNGLMKQRADRMVQTFQTNYKTKYPDDAKLDAQKVLADDDLKQQSTNINRLYSDLDYNLNSSMKEAKTYQADDMEDKNRKLIIKPYSYDGTRGFTVAYPDGSSESVKGIETVPQLTEFFKTKRKDRFNGRREGWFDQNNPMAEDELTGIMDKIRNTATNAASGLVGDTRKGISGVIQGADVYNIDSLTKATNRYRDAESTIEQLDPIIARMEKQKQEFPTRFTDGFQLSDLKMQRQQARDTIANKKAGIGNVRLIEDLNPMSEGLAMSPEEAAPQLTEAYKALTDEVIASQKIKGSRVAADVDDYIQREAMKKNGEDASFFSYFKDNPSQVIPYVASVSAQALPDLVALTAGSASGGAVGGVTGAALTAQAMGFAREYSASLLTEIQLRAAREGKDLTDPSVPQAYMQDQPFMDRIREKAAKRASAISVSEAFLGGIAEKIAHSSLGAFAKVASTTAASVLTESTGELAAQALAEPHISWRSVVDEGLGAFGMAIPTAVRSSTGSVAKVRQESILNVNKAKWANEMNHGVPLSDTPLAPAGAPLPTRDLTTGRPLPGEAFSYRKTNPNGYDTSVNSGDLVGNESLPEIPGFQTQERLTPEEIQKQFQQRDSQLTESQAADDKEIQRAQAAEKEAIAKGQDPNSIDIPQLDLSSEDTDVSTQSKREENGPRLVDRVLRFFDRQLTPDADNESTNLDPTIEAARIRKAREILSNPLYRSVYDIISDQTGASFDRIMEDFKNSNPDQDASGRLMEAIGLDPQDANKKILTDIIGSYWKHATSDQELSSYKEKGLAVSAAMTEVINEMTGVDSYYEMPMEDLRKVNKNSHIRLQLGQEGITEDGWPARSLIYENMSTENALKRLKMSYKAKPVNTMEFDPTLDNKFLESRTMDRPGMQPFAFGEFEGKTAKDIAVELHKKYGGKYIIKSKDGHAGLGIIQSIYSDGNPASLNRMEKNIQDVLDKTGYKDAYVEPLVEASNREEKGDTAGFEEYRVHVFVDENGKAHAFKNLTYKKRAPYQEAVNDSENINDKDNNQTRKKEDAYFIVPESPNNALVQQFQSHAEQIMSKPRFANNMFGLDMAMVDKDGKIQPFVFEGNATTMGMSGALGNAISQSEMISEMTGRPSVLSGLYQLAKLEMTQAQMNAVSSAIKERIDHPYIENIKAPEVIQRGSDIYTPYIPRNQWLRAMQSAFNAPVEFLNQLYESIRNVFSQTVDNHFKRKFEKQQETQKEQAVNESTKSNADQIVHPKEDVALRGYIEGLRSHPQLTENYRQILNFILKNSHRNLLDNIVVKSSRSTRSDYAPSNGIIRIGNQASVTNAVHEVIHSVTSDFLAYNSAQMQGAFGLKGHEMNNTSEVLSYYEAVKPENRQALLDYGVSEDYLNAIPAYLSVLESVGINQKSVLETGESPLGSDRSSYSYQFENSDKIPYGAISMDEMMTEAVTNQDFQKRLSKLPAIFTNAKNLFDEFIQLITRVLRIPIHKNNLLSDALTATKNVIQSQDNYFFADVADSKLVGAEKQKSAEVGKVGRKKYKSDDVSASTRDIASDPNLSSAKTDTLESIADQEKIKMRFSKLKKQYAKVLRGLKFDASNKDAAIRSLREAREKIINSLADEITNDTTGEKENVTPTKKKWMAALAENKLMAMEYLNTFGVDPSMPENHTAFVTDAVAHIMNETADPSQMKTNQIKYYNNILESFSDGGPPVGFGKVLTDKFIKDQMRAIQFVKEGSNLSFSKPIDFRRGEVLFGRFKGKVGSTPSFASEVAYMGSTEKSRKFLEDLTGLYRSNINDQQLELQMVSDQFYQYMKQRFPEGPRPINSMRMGIIARLTQYNASQGNPVGQILKRYSQIVDSLPVMRDMDKAQSQLTEKALADLIGNVDLSTLGDEKAIIGFLEGRLTGPEIDVLNKVREIGKYYLPSLQSVKALTRSAALDVYENYVHDSNISYSPPGEQSILEAFNSMGDVLQEREGINPNKKAVYPDLDIVSIADSQIRSATYEKYTGVERFLLNQSLGLNSPLTSVLDANTDSTQPITNRLRKILGSYHNAMVRSQPGVGPITGIVESLMNTVMGHAIIGINPLMANMASSSVQRLGLGSLSSEAFGNMFIYDLNKKKIFNWIKHNFPNQFNRTSEYDTLKSRESRWNTKNTWRASRDVKDGLLQSISKVALNLPKAFLDGYSDKILGTLSQFSNAIPERYNAFAMFAASYIHFAKENGTVKDANDFLTRLPVDKQAAARADDFVTRSLGYAPDKASKGDFWNGSATTKQVLSKAFYNFRQQATGLAINFQNEMMNTQRLVRSGNLKEANRSFIMGAALLGNSLAFRATSTFMRGLMLAGGLGLYFNAKDNEEKKKKLLEAQAKYDRNAKRNNIRDFVTETSMMMIPVATSAFAFEAAASYGMDTAKTILEPEGEGVALKYKQNIKDEIEAVNEEILASNKRIRQMDMRKLDTIDEEDKLEKMEQYKSQLTEQMKFQYFPSRGLKAFLSAFGGYGMAAEEMTDRIQNFVDSDLEDKEKIQLRNMEDNEFAYHDPLAGLNYATDMLRNVPQFVQNIYQFDQRKEDRIPNSLWLQSILKVGQNPAVVVERARKAMAQEAVKKERVAKHKRDRLYEMFLGIKPEKE